MSSMTAGARGGATSAEVQIKVLADELRRRGRVEIDPMKAAALASAGSAVQAAQERLTADLVLLAGRAKPEAIIDLSPVMVGQLCVDRASRRVTLGDESVHVTTKEYNLLCLLVTEPTRVFQKAELYRAGWGMEISVGAPTRTLDSHMCRLRKALGGAPWVPNLWGVGYSLLPPAAALSQAAA
jgi:DNA-binding winged helix-turn-helix (wHTH) protein